MKANFDNIRRKTTHELNTLGEALEYFFKQYEWEILSDDRDGINDLSDLYIKECSNAKDN